METTQPKPFVFVLMPFSNDFEDIYEVGIKPACIEAGSYCERVDEQIFDGSILDRVYNQINKADLLVADMTDRNPNVFYEVGYAHALGKRVILLTQRVEDIPFDLRPYPHIVYGDSITTLKAELVKRVSWFLQEGLTRASTTDDHSQFAYYLEGQRITEGARIKIAESSGHEGNWNDQFVFAVDLHVSVQNPNNKILTANFKYGFVFPPETHMDEPASPEFKETVLGDLRRLVLCSSDPIEYVPFFETSSFFRMVIPPDTLRSDRDMPVLLRFYLRHAMEDTAFTLAASDQMLAYREKSLTQQ